MQTITLDDPSCRPDGLTNDKYVEYVKWIRIRMTGGVRTSPPPLIDHIWHAHILDTRRYHAFCSLLGGFIHHDLLAANDSDELRSKRLQYTYQLYREKYTAPPARSLYLWDSNMPGVDIVDDIPFVHIGREDDPKSFSKYNMYTNTTVGSLLTAYFNRTGHFATRLLMCGHELVGDVSLNCGEVLTVRTCANCA